jgi:hypothetical protein
VIYKEFLVDFRNYLTKTMEFPNDSWVCFPAEGFDLAGSRSAADLSAEVMAQVRPNGRIMDHWRVALGGTSLLEAKVDLVQLIPAAINLPKRRLQLQFWPRDIAIRRNMVTSAWMDVTEMISANKVTILDIEDSLANSKEVLEGLLSLPDRATSSAALCWAVVIAEDGKLKLQLQHLPLAGSYLAAKPIFKR